MSFPRAKIHRFNETASITPAPSAYNPKLPTTVKGAVIEKSERFSDLVKQPAGNVEEALNSTVSGCAAHQQCLPVFRTPQPPRKNISKRTNGKPKFYAEASSSSESSICSKELSDTTKEQNNTKVRELEEKIRGLESEIKHLENYVAELKCDNNNAMLLSEDRFNELNNKYIAAVAENEIKCSELNELKSELALKCQILETLQNECKEPSSTVTEDHKVSEQEHEMKELSTTTITENIEMTTILQFENVLKYDDKSISLVSETVNEWKEKYEQMQEQITILQNEKDRHECEIEKLISELKEQQSKLKDEQEIHITEKASLEERIHSLSASLLIQEKTIASLEEELKDSELKLKDAEEYRSEIEKLNNEMNNLQLEVTLQQDSHTSEKSILEEKISSLLSSMSEQEETISRLQERLQNVESTLKYEEEKNIDIEKMAAEQSKQLVDIQNKCSEKEIEVMTLRNRVVQLEGVVNEKKHECDDLKVSVMNCQLTIVELQDKVDSLLVELNAANESVTKYREKLSYKEKECKVLEVGMNNNYATLDALKSRLLESEHEIERLNEIIENLESQITVSQQQVKLLQYQIKLQDDSMEKLKTENIAEIENVRADLLNSLEALKLQYTEKEKAMEQAYKEKEELIDSLYVDLEDVRSKIENLNECVLVLELSNEEQLKKLSLSEQQVLQLSDKLASNSVTLNKERIKADLLQDVIKMQDIEICQARHDVLVLSDTLQNRNNALSESMETNDVLKDFLATRDVEITSLSEQIDHQNECLKSALEQISNLKAIESFYKTQTDDVLKELSSLKLQVLAANEKISCLENERILNQQALNDMNLEVTEKNHELAELEFLFNSELESARIYKDKIDALEADKAVEEEKMKILMSDLHFQTKCCESYKDTVTSLQNYKLELENELQEKEDKITKLSAQLEQIQFENEELKENISTIDIANVLNEGKIVNLSEQISYLEAMKISLQNEVLKLSQDVQAWEEVVQKERCEMENLKLNMEHQKETEQTLRNNLLEKDNELANCKNKIEEQEKQLDNLKSENMLEDVKQKQLLEEKCAELDLANAKLTSMVSQINLLKDALLEKEYEFSDILEEKQKEFNSALISKENEYSVSLQAKELEWKEKNNNVLTSLQETQLELHNADLKLQEEICKVEQKAFSTVQNNSRMVQDLHSEMSKFESLLQEILYRESHSTALYQQQEQLLHLKIQELENIMQKREQEQERTIKVIQEDMDLSWKERCLMLEGLIGPFRDQLTAYESERNLLASRHAATEDALQDLASKYADVLGHQNHKQKIKHLAMLKDQNIQQKTKIQELEGKLLAQKKTIEKLKDELGTSRKKQGIPGSHLKGKENVEKSPHKTSADSAVKPLRELWNGKK